MKIAIASISILLCMGILFAQQGPFNRGISLRENPTDQIESYLGLTNDQLEALKELRSDFREAARQPVQEIAEISRQLREAIGQDPIDSDLVGQLRADIESRQKNVGDLRSNYRVSAKDILTEEQASLLVALQQVLQLIPAARQAAALNLLEEFERFPMSVMERQLRNRLRMRALLRAGEGAFPRQ